MKYSDFVKILTVLDKQNQIRDTWIDTVPSEINAAFFENTYVNSLCREIGFLKEQLIPATLLYDIDWFLYEVNRETGSIAVQNDTEITIKTLDDFLELVKSYYEFEVE
jgi:hypothetical protein